MSDPMRRLLGAAVGGAIGYGAFLMLEAQGIRALPAVGAGLALGAGMAAARRRVGWGIVIALFAVSATVVVEWWHYPFRTDESFGYFVTHLGSLTRNSKLSCAAAALLGLWFGMGRTRRARAVPAG